MSLERSVILATSVNLTDFVLVTSVTVILLRWHAKKVRATIAYTDIPRNLTHTMKLLLAILFALLTIASSLDAVCRKKIDPGRCRATTRRYGYSTKQKKCVVFFYGGCAGNGNNFKTKEECNSKCS
ncbi:hypothetical protein GCK32_010557 [Trichostrongylus colubriformis]|uniref:BPTI/Kunitz inhibitor domain-containing protein n=1 Tax=Trichostrongylus colubriformis TaxID=6319 RepID=A0AAN8F5R3_TRICO